MRGHLESMFRMVVVGTGARMFLIFAVSRSLLAVIGLYGVRSYTVALRTREIGIRMALGADARDAMRMMLREGLTLTAIGVGAGMALSLALGKVLSSLLYRVSGADPVVLRWPPSSGHRVAACVPVSRPSRCTRRSHDRPAPRVTGRTSHPKL
jgi:ABC-type antimicrobial peptide transport system permease subunit